METPYRLVQSQGSWAQGSAIHRADAGGCGRGFGLWYPIARMPMAPYRWFLMVVGGDVAACLALSAEKASALNTLVITKYAPCCSGIQTQPCWEDREHHREQGPSLRARATRPRSCTRAHVDPCTCFVLEKVIPPELSPATVLAGSGSSQQPVSPSPPSLARACLQCGLSQGF